MAQNGFPELDGRPRVQGVQGVFFQAHGFDLNRVATRVGSYQAGIGCTTHEVFDLPTSQLRPFVRDQIPDTIASDRDFTVIRLYVPVGQRGQINDIGILNGLYAAPRHPWVSTSGRVPMYCAPADEGRYQARCEPTRLPKGQRPIEQPLGDPSWRPGPGDRFRVTEL
jgi:hypothetical protein